MEISVRKGKYAKSGLHEFLNECKRLTKLPFGSIIEIGAYAGESTEIFAQHFEYVYSVDPWKNGYDDTDASSYKYDMKDVEAQFDKVYDKYFSIVKIKLSGDVACNMFSDETFDMVYIDAVHQYEDVKKDITNWLPKVKKGGIIAGHDFQESFEGVMRAVREVLGEPQVIGKDTSWGFVK